MPVIVITFVPKTSQTKTIFIIFHRFESSEFNKLVKDALNHEEIEDYACMYTHPPCPYQGRKLLEKFVITTPLPGPQPNPQPDPQPNPQPDPQPDPKPDPQPNPQPIPQPYAQPDPQPKKNPTEKRVAKEIARVPKNIKKIFK